MAGRSPHPANVRPNPTLGTYYYVPRDHLGYRTLPDIQMLAAYRFPPSTFLDPARAPVHRTLCPAFSPDTYIGPVVGVDHTPSSTSVLIQRFWVTVWECRPAAPPLRPAPTEGVHFFRPVARCYTRAWEDAWDQPECYGFWDQPFHDLRSLSPYLGISHVSHPGRYYPPRFLLTGAAWYRLHHVREFIRIRIGLSGRSTSSSGAPLEGVPMLPIEDLRSLARVLHRFLDYPSISHDICPPPVAPRLLPRSVSLCILQLPGVVPRARIEKALRRWILRRRTARTLERHRLILADRLFPPPILALDPIVRTIASCL